MRAVQKMRAWRPAVRQDRYKNPNRRALQRIERDPVRFLARLLEEAAQFAAYRRMRQRLDMQTR